MDTLKPDDDLARRDDPVPVGLGDPASKNGVARASSRTANAVAKAEIALLIRIADRTKLTTDALMGLQPMPDTVSGAAFRRLSDRAAQLVWLVRCVVQALECYDSDDGHNELVCAGIAAELRRIEDEYEGPADVGSTHVDDARSPAPDSSAGGDREKGSS